MSRRVVRAVLLVVPCLALGCKGEPKVLEPRTPPPRVAPRVDVPPTPPPEGHGRVIFESTDGSLRLTVKADSSFIPPGYSVPPTRTGELCVTPCAADLPVGRYKLYMTSADGTYSRGDTDVVDVRPGTTYYVRAPGRFEEPTWIPVLPTVLIAISAAMVVGGLTLATGDDDAQRTTGLLLAGGGVAVGVGGGILHYDQSRGAIQEGATTTWSK